MVRCYFIYIINNLLSHILYFTMCLTLYLLTLPINRSLLFYNLCTFNLCTLLIIRISMFTNFYITNKIVVLLMYLLFCCFLSVCFNAVWRGLCYNILSYFGCNLCKRARSFMTLLFLYFVRLLGYLLDHVMLRCNILENKYYLLTNILIGTLYRIVNQPSLNLLKGLTLNLSKNVNRP